MLDIFHMMQGTKMRQLATARIAAAAAALDAA
jgi:hypothetical protein